MVNHLAQAELDVAAPIGEVWTALTDTATLGEIMFGSTVETDWTVGSPMSTAASGRANPSKITGL